MTSIIGGSHDTTYKEEFRVFARVLEDIGMDLSEREDICDKLEQAIRHLPDGSFIEYIKEKDKKMDNLLCKHGFSILDRTKILFCIARRLARLEQFVGLNETKQVVVLIKDIILDLKNKNFSSEKIKKMLYIFIDVLKKA